MEDSEGVLMKREKVASVTWKWYYFWKIIIIVIYFIITSHIIRSYIYWLFCVFIINILFLFIWVVGHYYFIQIFYLLNLS